MLDGFGDDFDCCPSVKLFQSALNWVLPISAFSFYKMDNSYPALANQSAYSNRLPSCVHPSRTDYRDALEGCFKSAVSQTYTSPDNSYNRLYDGLKKSLAIAATIPRENIYIKPL